MLSLAPIFLFIFFFIFLVNIKILPFLCKLFERRYNSSQDQEAHCNIHKNLIFGVSLLEAWNYFHHQV